MLFRIGVFCALLTNAFAYSNPSQKNPIELHEFDDEEDDYSIEEDLKILEIEESN